MSPKGSPAPGATPRVSTDEPDYKVRTALDPYAGVTVRSSDGTDEAEPKAPGSLPLSVRGATVNRWGSVGDTDRRSGGEGSQGQQTGDGTTSRPTVSNLDDAHFTPGTLQREHDNDGYTKTRTRPTGRGKGERDSSGARQATMGTRGVEGGTPTKSSGPFGNK